MTFTVFIYAFFGGLVPSFIWLYFLLKEDTKHHEPKKLIALAFIAGMIAVPLALPLEQYAKMYFLGNGQNITLQVLTAWALIEEVLKYALAAAIILWRPAVDEAADYVIYMITVALGFAAAENMLFLITPIMQSGAASSIFTGDVRFLGSTLLHVVASASIGFALAFSHNSHPAVRVVAAAFGLILATALHTVFNALIISEGASATFNAFLFVWVVAVVFFAAFEVLKYFQYKDISINT